MPDEAQVLALLRSCELCPRRCRVDRLAGRPGFCRATGPGAIVSSVLLHRWEEPCISGTRGSGTVFFTHCNMRCAFCQNYRISHLGEGGRPVSVEDLAAVFVRLQSQGAHNVNLVSPTPYIPQIALALQQARSCGLRIPVVYNTNAYETVDALRLLRGRVDVYLPDLKYATAGPQSPARRYSRTHRYFETATAAIREMFAQVGEPVFDNDELIRRGLIIRHLVLPGHLDETRAVLEWIARNLPRGVYVSLMSQYTPAHEAARFPEIDRALTPAEYEEALDAFDALGLENGYRQDLASASDAFVPDFGAHPA